MKECGQKLPSMYEKITTHAVSCHYAEVVCQHIDQSAIGTCTMQATLLYFSFISARAAYMGNEMQKPIESRRF